MMRDFRVFMVLTSLLSFLSPLYQIERSKSVPNKKTFQVSETWKVLIGYAASNSAIMRSTRSSSALHSTEYSRTISGNSGKGAGSRKRLPVNSA